MGNRKKASPLMAKMATGLMVGLSQMSASPSFRSLFFGTGEKTTVEQLNNFKGMNRHGLPQKKRKQTTRKKRYS